jgi:transposase
MKLKTKDVRAVVKILDDIIEEYNENKTKKKRNWRTYEQQLSYRIRNAVRELGPLIEEAISSLEIKKNENRGRKNKLTLKQKVELLLIKHLFEKSNREMSGMLAIFSLLSDIDVSYKYVERLYSDEEVFLVLLNLHTLILKKKGIKNPDCSGDGTGYSLTIKKHYASVAQKLKNKTNKKGSKMGQFIFSFKLMDIDTRMYLGFGKSYKSEKDAFDNAIKMVKGSEINSIRLDRYYALQMYVEYIENLFGKDVAIYVIPKKNATIKGTLKWKMVLYDFVNDTKGFLGEYFKRNQSESGFSEDKRRFGWKIPQKRPDRIETYDFCTSLWHNLFWLGGN